MNAQSRTHTPHYPKYEPPASWPKMMDSKRVGMEKTPIVALNLRTVQVSEYASIGETNDSQECTSNTYGTRCPRHLTPRAALSLYITIPVPRRHLDHVIRNLNLNSQAVLAPLCFFVCLLHRMLLCACWSPIEFLPIPQR